MHLLMTLLADPFSDQVKNSVASPLLNAAQFLIPAFVFIAAVHKLMEHRESGGAFLVELVVKGGGAFLIIQLVKALFGVA